MRTTTRITLGIATALWVGAASVGVGSALSSTPSPTYTVRTGDTLSAIAANHSTTALRIAVVNGIANPDMITVGQRLTLPSDHVKGKPTKQDIEMCDDGQTNIIPQYVDGHCKINKPTKQPAKPKSVKAPTKVQEDSPGWDCRKHGNKVCGPNVQLPGGKTTGPHGYHCHPAFGADGLICAKANHLFGY